MYVQLFASADILVHVHDLYRTLLCTYIHVSVVCVDCHSFLVCAPVPGGSAGHPDDLDT